MEEPDTDNGTKSRIRVRKRKATPPRSQRKTTPPRERSSPRHGNTSRPAVKFEAAPAPAISSSPGVSPCTATVDRLFKTLPHVQARSEKHPEYRGKRKKVEDERVAWSVSWDGYDLACPEFTAKTVLDNGRQLYIGEKWADPPNAQELRAELDARLTYETGGKILFEGDGRPLNPRGRTGLRGRGLLGQWGPNHAANPIVTRREPLTGTMQVRTTPRPPPPPPVLTPNGFLTRVGCRHCRCWPSSARRQVSGLCRAVWSRVENRSHRRR
jgi:hypothetical protein